MQGVLTNGLYMGQGIFNRRNHKTGRLNPREDWIICAVPAIIPEATFHAVQRKRTSRRPAQVPPRVVASPTLLTGLLKCGACGGGMTLATGKGGRYRYYRCNTRLRTGSGCRSENIPTGKLDSAVRQALCERVFTERRVRRMLEALRERLDKARGHSSDRLRTLRAEFERNRLASERLYEAVERGLLPMDGTLTKRAHELQARRQALLADIAGLERERQFPMELLSPRHVEGFCRALRAKMLDPQSEFGKRYLRLLVEEIRVEGESVVMRGSYAALALAMGTKNVGTAGEVPRFGPGWLSGQGSNQQP